MATHARPGRSLLWTIVLFTCVGVPVVAVLWEVVNHALAGDLTLRRAALGLPALLLLALLTRLLASRIAALDSST
jgi:hypothetical protein